MRGQGERGCRGWRPTATIWPGSRRRIVRRRCRPGGRHWRGWRRPRGWPRMMAALRAVAPERITLALSAELTAALSRQARRHGLTLNTLLQGAWAHPARPADRARGRGVRGDGGGAAAGDCRHRAHGGAVHQHAAAAHPGAGEQTAAGLLEEVQDSQSRLMAHQHLGLAEIQGLTGLGELFDTLVVFENYPVDRGGLLADAGGLRLTRCERG